MSWSHQTAYARIQKHRQSAPETDVTVEDFNTFMEGRRRLVEASKAQGGPSEPIWRVGPRRAVTTHGVHVYANLMDFNDALLEAGRETEASHERAMQLLHLHYGACDALIEAFEIQRVDFHGSRLHAVVLTPEGAHNEPARIAKALAFSAALIEMVARAGRRYGAEFQTRLRIGVDSGAAVAINSGTRGEPDPLFIGSPANHAAHLADGDEAGVFLSEHVERSRRSGNPFAAGDAWRLEDDILSGALNETVAVAGAAVEGRRPFEAAYAQFVEDRDAMKAASGSLRPASFVFHYRQPPMRTLDFADHPPSRAVRMPVASIFADIAGFTAYVDHAIQTGRVREAVANLYVLRAEMADVLQKDFGGRKVRFIGDCLHGLIAEGDARQTDERATVRAAVLAAAGIRSSFELCLKLLPGLSNLEGVAIGIELGWTPVCRIGLSGDASVRCSASKATCTSEGVQQACSGHETAIGERAFTEGEARVRHLFGERRRVPGLTYAAAEAQLLGVTSPAIVRTPRLEAHFRP